LYRIFEETCTVETTSSAASVHVSSRWLVVIGAILIQLSLGAIYAWSVFTRPLMDAPFRFTEAQTQIIFSVALATFAIFTILAGSWQRRAGPTRVVRFGGLILASGYVAAGLVERMLPGHLFAGILLSVGLVGGAGIGLAYVVPIACCVRWFPDRKGLVTGCAVAGFGFGALLWIKLAAPSAGALLLRLGGVSNVLLAYGAMYFVLIMLGSLWMKNPPPDWSPPCWNQQPVSKDYATAGGHVNFEPAAMMATSQFWVLWIMYVCATLAGLMVIGIIQLFAVDALQARSGMTPERAAATAATAAGVFLPIFNGVGRVAWGSISDAIGRKAAIVFMFLLQGVTQLAFFRFGGTTGLLFILAASVGFNFGGALALFPAVTADFFGSRGVARNYGWMFTAYGVGGIIGPMMAGIFKTAGKAAEQVFADRAAVPAAALDAWHPAFKIAGVACLAAAVLGLLLHAPRQRPRETPVLPVAGIRPATT